MDITYVMINSSGGLYLQVLSFELVDSFLFIVHVYYSLMGGVFVAAQNCGHCGLTLAV
jgi:hypothetical protein